MINRKALSVAVFATAAISTLSASAQQSCDKQCVSYCAYYYPSDTCVRSCRCPEFAKQAPLLHEDRLRNIMAAAQDPESATPKDGF